MRRLNPIIARLIEDTRLPPQVKRRLQSTLGGVVPELARRILTYYPQKNDFEQKTVGWPDRQTPEGGNHEFYVPEPIDESQQKFAILSEAKLPAEEKVRLAPKILAMALKDVPPFIESLEISAKALGKRANQPPMISSVKKNTFPTDE